MWLLGYFNGLVLGAILLVVPSLTWGFNMNGDKEKNAFTAEAIAPLEADATYLAKMIFAENAVGGPRAWMNVGNVAMNRLKSGKYGKTLSQVIKGMSAAIQTKSRQWQKADRMEFTDYESKVFNKIKDVADGIVSGKVPDTVRGATHFENLNRYPMPYWAKDMEAVARDGGDPRWSQTYFRPK